MEDKAHVNVRFRDQVEVEDEDEIREAKKLTRPSMPAEDWFSQGLASCDLDALLGPISDNCERVNASEYLSRPEDFRERFEDESVPCIIQGLMDAWPAKTGWTLDHLAERFPDETFKCGETDEGDEVEVSLAAYARYANSNRDDIPLYVFDEAFSEDGSITSEMLREYEPPPFFNEDLFQYLGDDKRPPFRWVLLGPKRSGSRMHIDPCGTSAWNALISGRKRWVLFPPGTPRNVVKPEEWIAAGEGRGEAIHWFKDYFGEMPGQLPSHQRPIVCDMVPGDIIFVPGGWWHTVLNMEDTVAVTQNFVSSSNFPEVWREFQATRSKLSRAWLRALSTVRPDLVDVVEGKGKKIKAGQGAQGGMSRGKASRELQRRIEENQARARIRRAGFAFRMMKEYDRHTDDCDGDVDADSNPGVAQ